MDSARNIARIGYFVALALGGSLSATRAEYTHEYTTGSATSNCDLTVGLRVVNGGINSIRVTANNYTSYVTISAGQSMELGSGLAREYRAAFSGLVIGQPITQMATLTGTPATIKWRVFNGVDWVETGTLPQPVADGLKVIATRAASGPTNNAATLAPMEITINGDTATRTPDPYSAAPPPGPTYQDGVMLFDNRTGAEQGMKFGDEALTLQPGYNSFPFYGECDPVTGAPLALGDIPHTRVVGSDGQTYWVARLENQLEGRGTSWVAPPSAFEVMAQNSGLGPTAKIPDGAGGFDYVTLPPGMTRGNALPIPKGMYPDNGNKLPAGVIPGTTSALPKGVLSGGSTYLPPGVSAGTVAGAGAGGTTGGGNQNPVTGSAGAVSKDAPADNYVPGPAINPGDIKGDAEATANAIVEDFLDQTNDGIADLKQKTGLEGEGGGPKYQFTAPSLGKDYTWSAISVSLPHSSGKVEYTIKREYIDLVRSILLWLLRIYLVGSLIRILFF